MLKESRQKLAEKNITWKEAYTDKTEFLKEQFEDTVGPGSYFRFEGESPDGDAYYCIIGPAGIHKPKAKFFAGVRKLPATFSAGGKYFDSLDTAARYARETWGIDTPKDLKPYTQKQLFGIAKKIKKWKEERREETDSEKEDKDEKSAFSFPVNDLSKFSFTINDLTSESENFNITYLNKEAMAKGHRYRGEYQWITLEAALSGVSFAFNQLIENNNSIQAAIQDIKMEKMKRLCLIRQKYNISLTDAIQMMKFYLGFSRKHGLYMRIYAPYCMSPNNYSDLYYELKSYFDFTNRTREELENLGIYTNNLFESSKELMTEIINQQPSTFANIMQDYCTNSPQLQVYFPDNPDEINADVKKCPLIFYTKLLSWYKKNQTTVEWKGQIFWATYATIFLNDLKRKLSLHYSDTSNIFAVFDKAYPIADNDAVERFSEDSLKAGRLKSGEMIDAEVELTDLSFEEIGQHMRDNNGIPPVSKLGLDCYSFINLTPSRYLVTEKANRAQFYDLSRDVKYSNEDSVFTPEVISYLPSQDPNNGIYSLFSLRNDAQRDNVVITRNTRFFMNRDGIKKMILNLIAKNQQIFNDENLTRNFLDYMRNYLISNVAATTNTNLFISNLTNRITSDLKTFIYFVTGINSGLDNDQIEELENISNSSYERFNRNYVRNVRNDRIQVLKEGVNPFENGTLNYDIVMPQKLVTKEFRDINRRRFELTTNNILSQIVKAMVQFIKENEGNEYCSDILIKSTQSKGLNMFEPSMAFTNSSLNQTYSKFINRKKIQLEIALIMEIENINVINQNNIDRLFIILNELGGLDSFNQMSQVSRTRDQRRTLRSDLREQGLDAQSIKKALDHDENRYERIKRKRSNNPIFTKEIIKALMLEILTPTIVSTACNFLSDVDYNNEREFIRQVKAILGDIINVVLEDRDIKIFQIKVLENLKNNGPNNIVSLEENTENIKSEIEFMEKVKKSKSKTDEGDNYIANVSIDSENGEIYQTGFFSSLRSCIEGNKYLWDMMSSEGSQIMQDPITGARLSESINNDSVIGRASIIDTRYNSSVLSNIVSELDTNLIERYRRTRSNRDIALLLKSLMANNEELFDQINQGDLDYQLEHGEIIKEDLEITLEEIELEEPEEEVIEVAVDTNNFAKEISNAINQGRNYQNFVRLVTAIQQYPVSDNPDRSVNINVNYDSNLFWNIIGLFSNGKNISEEHKNIIINNFPQSMQFYLDGPQLQEEITLQQQEAEEELPQEEDEDPFAIEEDNENVRNAKNNTVRNIIKLSSQLDKEGKSKQSIELLEIAKRILRKKDK
jgi:hypothetical protein